MAVLLWAVPDRAFALDCLSPRRGCEIQPLNPALVRHFGNAILREDARGSRITKNHKGSSRKIDAAVASLIAYHRAAVWREVEAPAEPQLLVL